MLAGFFLVKKDEKLCVPSEFGLKDSTISGRGAKEKKKAAKAMHWLYPSQCAESEK
jgi:hypothetical protein